ncbi:hypothetical protein BDB01DRAFT_776897, partial [Pilobolus umbonatus]
MLLAVTVYFFFFSIFPLCLFPKYTFHWIFPFFFSFSFFPSSYSLTHTHIHHTNFLIHSTEESMSSPLLAEFSTRYRHSPHRSLIHSSRNIDSSLAKHKAIKTEILYFYARLSEGSPPIPYYLKDTVYAHLVAEQSLLFAKRKNTDIIKSDTQSSLSADDDNEDTTIESRIFEVSITPTQRNRKIPSDTEYAILETLMLHNSYNLSLATQDLRLPSAWDVKSKNEIVDVSVDCMQLTYKGSRKEENDISAVTANYAIRRQCGIYYFEIQVISKGTDGHITIGVCKSNDRYNRLPRWVDQTWGYYAEDGHICSDLGTSKPYGPKYSAGDVIGCGFDFRDMSAFFTKNGIYLGTAFRKIREPEIYPFVGFKTPGERIEANFGQKPFRFDIVEYMANEKRELLNKIALRPIHSTECRSSVINDSVTRSMANGVVMEYMRHNGYNKSAKALEQSIQSTDAMKESSMALDVESMERQEIRNYVLTGDIDKVIELCNVYYPDVLLINDKILFRLKCRKFIEMVKSAQQLTIPVRVREEEEANELEISQTSYSHSVKRSISESEVDHMTRSSKKARIISDDIDNLRSFTDIMTYGNQLKQEYEESAKHDPYIKLELMRAFSTLAYPDLSHPAISYLFELSYIEELASELNSAILVSLNRYPNSALERIYKQTCATVEELILGGNAKAALLEPQWDCLRGIGP